MYFGEKKYSWEKNPKQTKNNPTKKTPPKMNKQKNNQAWPGSSIG